MPLFVHIRYQRHISTYLQNWKVWTNIQNWNWRCCGRIIGVRIVSTQKVDPHEINMNKSMVVVDDGVVLAPCPVLSAMYGDRDRITAASSIFRMQSTLFWTPHHHRSLQSVPTMSQWVIQGILQKFTRIDHSVCLGWFMKILHLSIFAKVSQSMADFGLPGCPVMTLCWLGVLN